MMYFCVKVLDRNSVMAYNKNLSMFSMLVWIYGYKYRIFVYVTRQFGASYGSIKFPLHMPWYTQFSNQANKSKEDEGN